LIVAASLYALRGIREGSSTRNPLLSLGEAMTTSLP
jgi:hypothetical protein